MKLLFILPVVFLLSNTSSGQNTFPLLSMDVVPTPVSNYLSADSLPSLTDSTVFEVDMNIALFDTLDIDKIYVNLGNDSGATNLLQQIFDWDVAGNTGNGTSYSRHMYNVVLHLGNFSGMLDYKAEVALKRSDGSMTEPVSFNR